jgi:hypothetical protein
MDRLWTKKNPDNPGLKAQSLALMGVLILVTLLCDCKFGVL